MRNWRNRPTVLDYIPENIDTIVSIDESGNSSLKQVLKAKSCGHDISNSDKHFTITACVISKKDFTEAQNMVMSLKHKYWTNALYNYKNETKRVCFHSSDIRSRRGAFNPDKIDYGMFIVDLSNMIANIPMKLYYSHIDKLKHVNKYIYPDSPYDLCMNFILERLMLDLPKNERCLIVLESRGKKEDNELLNQIKNLLDFGNNYHDTVFFSKIKGVYFNSKWCKEEQNMKSYWELELADLCAYPVQKYFLYNTKDPAFKTIEPKICHYPNYLGKGLKSFP